jgi:hypothetical protein
MEGLEFLLQGAEVEDDVTAKVGAESFALVHGNDRVLQVAVTGEGFLNVHVVEALDFATVVIAGVDRGGLFEDLRKRRKALLTIEDKLFRHWRGARWKRDALDCADLKASRSASLKEHDAANRERTGDTHQQGTDMRVIPDPAALEIGKLDFSLKDFF